MVLSELRSPPKLALLQINILRANRPKNLAPLQIFFRIPELRLPQIMQQKRSALLRLPKFIGQIGDNQFMFLFVLLILSVELVVSFIFGRVEFRDQIISLFLLAFSTSLGVFVRRKLGFQVQSLLQFKHLPSFGDAEVLSRTSL